MWIIVATLSLISFFEDNHNPDGDDIACYAFCSLAKGFIWLITIWVALALWASTKDTPIWAENLAKLYRFVTRKEEC
jgi:hypothetical protein